MGKGGGPLNAWLKEFIALVFTHTVQAFIYAIIISLILYGLGNTTGVSPNDNNSALGLMAVFALTSVFKVEEMLKKIIGMGDSKASPKGAMKSLAKTAFAVQLGKRVLNNVGKVAGGIRSINQSRQDNRKAKERLKEDMEDNGFIKGADGKLTYVGRQSSAGSSGGNSSSSSSASTRGGASSAGGGSSATGASNDISASDQRRMRNALRNYEDRASEIKKQRSEGIKSIASGTFEFVGAGVGAAAGGLIAGSDGNLDELVQGIIAGAGVGDAVGESAVNIVDKATKFVQRNYNRKSGISNKALKRSIDSYKDALKNSNVYHGSASVDDIDI